MVIVFVSLWQITIFLSSWCCPGSPDWCWASATALCARPTPPTTTKSTTPATDAKAAAITRVLRLSVATQLLPSLAASRRLRRPLPAPIGTRFARASDGRRPTEGLARQVLAPTTASTPRSRAANRLLQARAGVWRSTVSGRAHLPLDEGQYSRPASTSGLRPQAKVVSYQLVIGVNVVPFREECTIQPFPT
jgi:hypothetical protein